MDEIYIKKKIRDHWDWRAKDYDKSPGHTGMKEVWKEVLSEVFDKKMRILDVGTGTGFLALILAELGHDVIGIDLSREMINIAKKKVDGLKIKFVIGDAENLPFNDESFDAVICRHVVWTLPNPQKAVKEWYRVLKDGGKIVMIDGEWYQNSMLAKFKRFIGRLFIALFERRLISSYKREISKYLPLYRQGNLEKVVDLLKNAGFSDVLIKDISWIRKQMLENLPFYYKLTWSSRRYFMVECFK